MKIQRAFAIAVAIILIGAAAAQATDRGLKINADSAVPPDPFGRYHALIVGINAYTEWNPLRTAVNDAIGLKQLLTERYDFAEQDVVLLSNEQATRSAIFAHLRSLCGKLGERDNLLIYFAGHGQVDDLTGEGYWIPVEGKHKDPSTWVDHAAIKNILSSEKVKVKNVVIIADSCYSGTLLRAGPSLLSVEDAQYRDKLLRLSSLRSRQVITSGGLEPVADGGRDGHSLFAYYMLKALKENTTETIDIENLFLSRVWGSVAEIGSQRPNVGRLKSPMDEDGQFVLFDRANRAREKAMQEAQQRRVAEQRQMESETQRLAAQEAQQRSIVEEKQRLEDERKRLAEQKSRLAEMKALLEEKQRLEQETRELRQLQEEKQRLEEQRRQLAALKAPEKAGPDREMEQVPAQGKVMAAVSSKSAGPILSLRATPIKISASGSDVILRSMLRERGFFDSQLNANGSFAGELVDNQNGTVTDLRTNLMWQKEGDEELWNTALQYDRVTAYRNKLNREAFAGHSDWRIPTIEELASLALAVKSKQGLHIDPIFKPIRYLTSADYFGLKPSQYAEVQFAMDFEMGSIGYPVERSQTPGLGRAGVRLVRSIRPSP